MKKRVGGFTLIELLVVISIISLLSSVVLASLASARDKARIASGQQFSSSLYHAYGADGVAAYDFDEPSGTIAYSSSGSVNASITGTVTRTTETPGGTGRSLLFPGTQNDYAMSQSIITAGTTWTLAAWVKPTASNGIFLSFGLPYLNYTPTGFHLSWNNSGQKNLYDPNARNPGKWYHVAATHKGNVTVLYVDGKEVQRDPVSGSDNVSQVLFIGKHPNISGTPFTGYVDDVRVYTQSLVASDIQKLYAQGLEAHPNLALLE